MDERTRHSRAIRWHSTLNQIAAKLVRVLSVSVGLLIITALLAKPDSGLLLIALAASFVVAILSGLLYLIVTISRDANAHGKQV